MSRLALVFAAIVGCLGAARAQEGSLAYATVAAPGATAPTLTNSSFIFQTLPPEAMTRPLEVQSIIQVLVDYRAVTESDGNSQTRRTGSYSAALTNWLRFDGKSIKRAPQKDGDPTISGTLNSQMRTQNDMDQSEAVTFTMAATVVDIQPNGNLVIEGRSEIRINEEEWMVYISGIVPREAIGPDRVVRDSSIADKRIHKYERGMIHDGYARGWMGKWYGKYKAF